MTMKQILRIVLDIAMIVLLLCAYAYRITGNTIHKLAGIGIFVLFSTHIAINRYWFTNVFKGAYTLGRILITVVNILLVLVVATMVITGSLEAVWTSSLLQFETEITIREMHTIAAYWFIPLIGVHIGLHWGNVLKVYKQKKIIIVIMRILAILFFAFGVWSFYDRDMFAKLFLGFSFDYWSLERPFILFFVETLSIIGIFVFITYYCMKLIYWLKNR